MLLIFFKTFSKKKKLDSFETLKPITVPMSPTDMGFHGLILVWDMNVSGPWMRNSRP